MRSGSSSACSKLACSALRVVITPLNWVVRAGTDCSPVAVAGNFCPSVAESPAGVVPRVEARAGTAWSANWDCAAASPFRSVRSAASDEVVISGLKLAVRSLNLGATENRPGMLTRAIRAAPDSAMAIPSAHFLIRASPCGHLDRPRETRQGHRPGLHATTGRLHSMNQGLLAARDEAAGSMRNLR